MQTCTKFEEPFLPPTSEVFGRLIDSWNLEEPIGHCMGTCADGVDIGAGAALDDAPHGALHQVQQVVVRPEADQRHDRRPHHLHEGIRSLRHDWHPHHLHAGDGRCRQHRSGLLGLACSAAKIDL